MTRGRCSSKDPEVTLLLNLLLLKESNQKRQARQIHLQVVPFLKQKFYMNLESSQSKPLQQRKNIQEDLAHLLLQLQATNFFQIAHGLFANTTTKNKSR